jgi:hypothetical protein
MMSSTTYTARYFLTRRGEPELEVTEAEFVAAEREAGFDHVGDPTAPATGGFGTYAISGRVDLIFD